MVGLVGPARQAVAIVVAGAASGATLAWSCSPSSGSRSGPSSGRPDLTGALLGFAISAVFVVLAGLPATAPLGERLTWFALGAVPGLALMVLARRGPGRSILVGLGALRKVWSALLHDNALRAHALRLAVAVGAGSLLYRLVDLPHGYWVPLTTLAILQPTEHGTIVRSLQRAAGTLLAAALIVGIVLVTDQPLAARGVRRATAFLLYALDERGYFWLVVLLTPTVLLMISAVDFEGDTVALDRVADSMLGIVIGLAFGELANAGARIRGARPPTFDHVVSFDGEGARSIGVGRAPASTCHK